MIKIAIADDHPMIIKGLKNILMSYPHIQLTGSYFNGEELLNGLKENVPDVLLLDIQMPGKTGEELAPVILKRYPDMKILILTNLDSTIYVSSMFRQGAKGYLLKNTDEDILINAIEMVFAGNEYIEDQMKERLRQLEVAKKRSASMKSSLTAREKEVLQLIVDGETTAEIAAKLFLSHHTVENYRISILIKLNVKNTAALVNKALKMGWAQ